MDERKQQQPQIDHCFHSAAGQNESCACWEVRAERAALPCGHQLIAAPLPQEKTPNHETKEFQFASDTLEGADGVITKWRGETLSLLCDHLS